MMKLYKRAYYKLLDIRRKANFFFRRLRYKFHPDIHIGRNVEIGRNVKIEILFGGEINIGNNTEILDGCRIWSYGGNIKIGNNCSINPYTVIYGNGGATIGNDVLIAAHSMIVPANHIYSNPETPIRKQGMSEKGIIIENDVWISHGCTIIDGVCIGMGSIIGAGSVVNRNVPANTVFAGIPAQQIKKR
ncbi:2,3,4,5-tetrahydropyridine-2,6-dicarboxylate N-acetyltransferase [bioreactor metagenome]|uniref:2,3,4,5-tetrahydropyridine-2,6-dicarboxylate N-acetyltransferase n=1 Tax=bioreactor metagenome TaxID=1076179 RepID=A0A644X7V2_9ZZZZ